MAKNIDIPEGWEVKKLGEVCNIHDGIHSTPKYTSSGVKFISVEDIADYTKTNKYISKNDFEKFFKYKPKINDIFLTRIGNIGTPALIYTDEDIAYYVTISLLHNIIKQVESKFLYYLIQGNEFQQEIYKRTLHVAFPKKINLNEIGECKILLPPIDEQKKIADILSLWDKAIQQTKDLIAYKETQKKGLMQNLLTGKKRLHGFNEKWKHYHLKYLIKEVNIRNKNNEEIEILSVSNKHGFIMQDDFFDKRVASKNTKNYKIVKRNQFAYNPSRINVGSIALLENFNIGLLSPMYIVFECNNLLSYVYFNYWVTSHLFTGVIKTYLSGSVRDSLNFKDMGQISIILPPLEEQKAIADILSKADEEINLLNKQLDLYTEQKKGLMQNLLTGKIRV